MKRPLIGISGSHNEKDRTVFVRENYMASILRAGGLPVLLPEQVNEAEASAYLDELDGLLLAGGGDVDPVHYGEALLPECGEIDPQRDAFELMIAPMALDRGMPVFGICRGIQILNVVSGGTLYQDLESQTKISREKHYQQPPYDEPLHEVDFTPGGLLERITGTSTMSVNSTHHQAVKNCGENLIVEALSKEGIIEGVRSAVRDDVFGVQFHPEHFAYKNAYAQRLFDYFVACAVKYAEKK